MFVIGDRVVMKDNRSVDHELIPNGAIGTIIDFEGEGDSLAAVDWDLSYGDEDSVGTYHENFPSGPYNNIWRVERTTLRLLDTADTGTPTIPPKHQKVLRKIRELNNKKVPLRKVKTLAFPDKAKKNENQQLDELIRAKIKEQLDALRAV